MEIKKEDIRQEVFDLYDDYAHSRINRRDFVQSLSVYAVGGLTVSSLMSFLMPDYQNTIQVKADAALKANGKEYTAFIYSNANHGFHNDTTPRFDKAAAELAWQRTIEFFHKRLE